MCAEPNSFFCWARFVSSTFRRISPLFYVQWHFSNNLQKRHTLGHNGLSTAGIFLHLFHQCFLANTMCTRMAHEISGLHAFFHFVGNHIAPVASGKSHDESEVTFFVSGKADGKMFLYFQGNVILGVFHRISVLVGIYAEQRESLPCMSVPHPVIRFLSEFT